MLVQTDVQCADFLTMDTGGRFWKRRGTCGTCTVFTLSYVLADY